MVLALAWLMLCTLLAIIAADGMLTRDYPQAGAAGVLLLGALYAGKD